MKFNIFELRIFFFNSYACYLSRGLNFLTCAFNLPTRVFSVPTPAFNLATRVFSLVTRGFELVTRGFELVTRNSCFTFPRLDFGFLILKVRWPHFYVLHFEIRKTNINGIKGTLMEVSKSPYMFVLI